MANERWSAPGRDLQRELLYGGPVLGTGDAPDGRWEVRSLYDAPEPTAPGYLYFYVEFWDRHGRRSGGGGCGGVGIANGQRPVVLSMSRRWHGSFCYVGQIVERGTRVQLSLTDGTTSEALLLKGDLPVQLWIAFTDGTAVPTAIRGFDGDTQLDECEIAEDWPPPSANSCWGPFDADEPATGERSPSP